MSHKYVMQIMWHINDECNLCCRHCYSDDLKRQPIDRWEFQQFVIRRIVELQKYYHLVRVGLLGGEPLFDPNVLVIAKSLYAAGVERVDLGSNGTLIDKSLAEKLKAAGVKMVQISLEGPSSEINDFIRGQGSFQKAITGLRWLKGCGVDTGIMVTVSKFNLAFIGEMVELAFREGVKLVAFNRLLPLGRAKEKSLQCLTPLETKQMISLVHFFDKKYPGLDVSSDDPLLYVPLGGKRFTVNAFGGCGAGVGNLAICHEGTVFPCRRLPIKVGDIKKSSLADIITSSRLDCFFNRGTHLKDKCALCDHRQICGGCRAAAYAFTGDHLGSDPQCWM
ncbi:radical SAM protein [Patescibacteria group bacterium]|nr:radical SAM protein [Patescibacteria group bacterium]